MERDRTLNFKLLVPPRVNKGQVSAVRPQEILDSCGDFINTVEKDFSKHFEKEQKMHFGNSSMVALTKPSRQDLPKMKAVYPLEKDEKNLNHTQLYTKLFDEVEKIKSWKIKADSDNMQKERRLQENKRTIETQRKAIQELQFGNESLSIKLEQQITENEDLRNKNNATRNLCNILKDTFERSAEKMHLFESEREETHHMFMENNENVQKLISTFESLRLQAQADQQEMEKVKEGLQQFEVLKEKFDEEYNQKEKEVAALQAELKEKENDLQKILHDLRETQQQYQLIEESKTEQHELLKNSETEKESLLQRLQDVDQRSKETDKTCEALTAQLEENKAEYEMIIQSKDLSLQELSQIKIQQSEKLELVQKSIQKLQSSLALETQKAKDFEDQLLANERELEKKITKLGVLMDESEKKDEQIKTLEDEFDKQCKCVKSMQEKIASTEVRVEELEAELRGKNNEALLFKSEADVASAENDLLKKAYEAAKKDQEDLREKSAATEIKVQELEQLLFCEVRKNEEHTSQMEQLRKNITQHEAKHKELLSSFNELQSEKKAIQLQLESGSSNLKAFEENIKMSEGKAAKLTEEIQRLEEENQGLRAELDSIKSRIQGTYDETQNLQKKTEEKCEYLQQEITGKEKQIKAVETKLFNLRKKFELRLKANEELKGENKQLKDEMAKETAKLNELQSMVQHLRTTTAEAIKTKEDTELKCQHRIADMVTLMEKHKSQYDLMVEQKDAELSENRKREMEASTQRKSLELDFSKEKADNGVIKQELKTALLEKANLQKELAELKKEMSLMKTAALSETRDMPSTLEKCPETPKEHSAKRYVFDFSKSRKTPSLKNDGKDSDAESIRTPYGTTPRILESQNGGLKTPLSVSSKVGGASNVKSYRIRTPPSAEKASGWKKRTIELDPKSDSSDINDLLTFASMPKNSFSELDSKVNQKIQSPVPHKSPGNPLKVAAMKRMRDAGWTAVTRSNKKNKKGNERIFA